MKAFGLPSLGIGTLAIILGCSAFPEKADKGDDTGGENGSESSGDNSGEDSGDNGGDNGGEVTGPGIEVSPTSLAFEDGGSAVDSFSITSIGDETLSVDEIVLSEGTAFSLSFPDGAAPLTLAPGDAAEVEVTYAREGDADSDVVSIFSNDPAHAEVTVALRASGGGEAGLILDPDAWDAGVVAVGDAVNGAIDVYPVGTEAVTIESLSVSGGGFSGEWTFSLPQTVAPGDDLRIPLRFAPTDSGAASGRLVVTSDAGVYNATLSGEGASGAPVAVCDVDPASTDVGTAVMFLGEDSYDAGGSAIASYTWTLVDSPATSTATLPSGSAANRRFTPDVAGSYTAELVVTNENGDTSDACEATLEAAGGGGYSIQLTWDEADDDMDLHLLRPGGTLLDTEDDCHYGNLNPDWGTRGDASDDPELVADDIEGTGPEEIIIDTFGESGTYEVWVVDYTGSTGDSPSVTQVTVDIYEGGVLVFSDTQRCSGECSDMHFADIDGATGAVSAP